MTAKELTEKYTLDELMGFLPGTIIHNRKKIFFSHETYDLMITKEDSFNSWVVTYHNDRTVKTYFRSGSKSLKWAIAEMLVLLLNENFIKL